MSSLIVMPDMDYDTSVCRNQFGDVYKVDIIVNVVTIGCRSDANATMDLQGCTS